MNAERERGNQAGPTAGRVLEGYDAAFTKKTEVSESTEWCVHDPSRIAVLAVHDVTSERCPWKGYCPYTSSNNKVEGAPWGGRCPCQPSPICKRAGCGRPTWNGEEGQYCGRKCMMADQQ
mmetsp:Transcript_71425/g.165178  ORF Transcript_71425/g.165178 Transcript_71425/m.165178 type:complete len:120 (+) Transcript_71425:834-1193(+)